VTSISTIYHLFIFYFFVYIMTHRCYTNFHCTKIAICSEVSWARNSFVNFI